MKKNEIDKLLEKYWRAETTTAEEKLIKAYFQKQLPDINDDDEAWFKAINRFQQLESGSPDTPVYRKSSVLRILNLNILLKIAAIFIIVIGLVFIVINHNQQQQFEKDAMVRKTAEADWLSITDAIHQGKTELNQSAQFILDIKTQK